METTLSSVLGTMTGDVAAQGARDVMDIAEFSALIRDIYYPSGMNEARVTGNGKTGDGLHDILARCTGVVERSEVVEAMKAYRRRVAEKPKDSGLHYKLGICSLLLSDRRSALEEYRILKSIDPSTGDALLYRWNIRTPWAR